MKLAIKDTVAGEGAPSEEPSLAGKRVLYILPQPFFSERGSSFRALATIKGLTRLGMSVDVLAYPFGNDPQLKSVRLFRSNGIPLVREVPIGPSVKKLLMDVPLFFSTMRRTVFGRYDVLHGVEEGALMAYLASRVSGTPYIFDMHSWMSEQLSDAGFSRNKLPLNVFRAFETRAMRKAAAIITVGSAHTRVAEQYKSAVQPIALHDYALCLGEPDQSVVHTLRAELAIQEKQVLLYTGNFEVYQGLELLLRSFALLLAESKAHPTDPVLVLVGGAPTNCSRTRQYRALAEALGIASRVVFTGPRPSEEMASFMAMADVLVSPRILGKNTPLKIYTYMEAKRIIVATDIDTHTQVLDRDCAILAPASEEEFARALALALARDQHAVAHRERLITRALELTKSQFSESAFIDRLRECYLQALGRAKGRTKAVFQGVMDSAVFALPVIF